MPHPIRFYKHFFLICLVFLPVTLKASNLQQDYKSLRNTEQQLALAYTNLKNSWPLFAFFSNLQDLSSLTDRELNPSSLNELYAWYQAHSQYHKDYDDYLILKQAYIIKQTRLHLLNKLEAMGTVPSNAYDLWLKMEDIFVQWESHQEMLGYRAEDEAQKRHVRGEAVSAQSLQNIRKSTFWQYFTHAKSLRTLLYHPPSKISSFGRQTLAWALYPFKYLGMALGLSLGGPAYLAISLFHKSPLYSLGMSCMRASGCLQSPYKNLQLIGYENLRFGHKGSTEQELTLYLPSHRSMQGDLHLMAAMHIPQALTFANTFVIGKSIDGPLGKGLGNLFAELPECVAVGQCRGFRQQTADAKALAAVQKHKFQNIINYPQGFVPNIHEILGITPTFVSKLLKPLLDRSFRVNIVPIAYDIESDFLWKKEFSKKDTPPSIKVGQPLSYQMVNLLVSLETQHQWPNLLGTYLRAFWIENITDYPELSLQAIDRRIRAVLGLNQSLLWD